MPAGWAHTASQIMDMYQQIYAKNITYYRRDLTDFIHVSIDFITGGEVNHVFARKTKITLKISIIEPMLLHKSYINVAIASTLHPL